MSSKINCVSVFSLLTALSACGGSDSTAGPAEVSRGIVPAGIVVTYDEGANEFTITDGVTSATLVPNAILDSPGFSGYWTPGVNFASAAETSSGSGRVVVVISEDTEFSTFGTFFERIGETDVPKSGSANYAGDYIAYLTEVANNNNADAIIQGVLSLDVDFAGTASGTITDRQSVAGAGGTFLTLDDLVLEASTITNGGFSGTTSGGAINNFAGSTVDAGDYGGIFTGDEAEEIVGGVQLTHMRNGTDEFLETGAFIAEQP